MCNRSLATEYAELNNTTGVVFITVAGKRPSKNNTVVQFQVTLILH